jgi:exodeoxyribonuclease-3
MGLRAKERSGMSACEPLRVCSWNVNGLRAVMAKGFGEAVARLNADILALQETKLQAPQVTEAMGALAGYRAYWAHATRKKGYSGVAVYTRREPLAVRYGIGEPRYDDEGRVLELDFGDFVFFNVYFPNGQMSPERLAFKLDFYRDFFAYAERYRTSGRHLVITGDYNTAHREIDLANPKANAERSGFLPVERAWLDRLAAGGYVDTFRHFYPDRVCYSWWTYRFRSRERDIGWRIDYVFVNREMIAAGLLRDAFIDNSIFGSDHCPVGVDLCLPAT